MPLGGVVRDNMRTSFVNREYRFGNRNVPEQSLKEGIMQSAGDRLPGVSDTHAMFNVLRQSADVDVTESIELLVRDAPDHKLCRINVLDFASKNGLNEEHVIAAFIHASRIGLFELSWNVLCPGCGGVLDPNVTLKTVRREKYDCEPLCGWTQSHARRNR